VITELRRDESAALSDRIAAGPPTSAAELAGYSGAARMSRALPRSRASGDCAGADAMVLLLSLATPEPGA